MQNITNIFNLPFLYICLIGSTVYCLWYLDKKRVLDPNYHTNVKNTRQSAALAKSNAFGSQSLTFPSPYDLAGRLKFALCKIKHAEQCAEAAIGDGAYLCRGSCKGQAADIGCREEAAVCVAEALYVLSYKEAEVMLAHAKSTLPLETYSLVCDKYAKLKKK
ncbi:uncharacterized protein LOC113547772 [Rhopalosiphum maidis]|uniref:uncharacterized protein LOC113547772 n=1 Tax=Rhopalosiphum maidis TaxID=43146 RepID=UPI000F00FCA2|nr:uncharacterized protein LOC113547772 [Rhopalosiphum maidis]